jgi:hypothetical protein
MMRSFMTSRVLGVMNACIVGTWKDGVTMRLYESVGVDLFIAMCNILRSDGIHFWVACI